MRRYETPNQNECTVSNGAKRFIDSTMDTVSHIEATIEEAKKMKVPKDKVAKLEEMRDLNLDLVAIACRLEKIQNGAKREISIEAASARAAEKHMMEHIMGMEDIHSPAVLDPADSPKDHGSSPPVMMGKLGKRPKSNDPPFDENDEDVA